MNSEKRILFRSSGTLPMLPIEPATLTCWLRLHDLGGPAGGLELRDGAPREAVRADRELGLDLAAAQDLHDAGALGHQPDPAQRVDVHHRARATEVLLDHVEVCLLYTS